jgi:hypothetical protein
VSVGTVGTLHLQNRAPSVGAVEGAFFDLQQQLHLVPHPQLHFGADADTFACGLLAPGRFDAFQATTETRMNQDRLI